VLLSPGGAPPGPLRLAQSPRRVGVLGEGGAMERDRIRDAVLALALCALVGGALWSLLLVVAG